MLNRKWRAVEMIEILKMAICDLEDVIASTELTNKEIEWIWPIERKAFEVY